MSVKVKLNIPVIGGIVRVPNVLDAPYSTVIFLESEKHGLILIDPGSQAVLKKLETEFVKMNKKPEDVKHIVLSHFHMDHAFNSIFFKNATVHIHSAYKTKDYSKFGILDGKCYQMVMKSWKKIETFEDGERLFDFIEIYSSPWHAREHVSMILDLKGGRYFLPGDVCPTRLEYYDIIRDRRKDEVASFIKNLASKCDMIIFPHDEPLRIQGGTT